MHTVLPQGEKNLNRLLKKVVAFLVLVSGNSRNAWRQKKASAFFEAILYIPYRRVKFLRRTKRQVEEQYDSIAGMYIRDNYQVGKERFCIVNGEVQWETSLENMRLIRTEINDVLEKVPFSNVLEVGAGELTSLSAVCEKFGKDVQYFGVDLSLNRLQKGAKEFSARRGIEAKICKSDAVRLPFEDDTFDLVYTRHTLEQIPQLYRQVLSELIRVSKRRIVLFEPSYELGSITQKLRMLHKDYVRGIPKFLTQVDTKISVHAPYLMKNSANPLNHTACFDIRLSSENANLQSSKEIQFVCPKSKKNLQARDTYLYCSDEGRAFPIVEGIPILEMEHSLMLTE